MHLALGMPNPLEEAGENLATGHSHAWVQNGAEYVEPRPMTRGRT